MLFLICVDTQIIISLWEPVEDIFCIFVLKLASWFFFQIVDNLFNLNMALFFWQQQNNSFI